MVAPLRRPTVNQDLSLVFYDLTTIRTASWSEQAGDVRQYGMAKEGLVARQFMPGAAQTAEGVPIYHEVFDGNQAESHILLLTLQKVIKREFDVDYHERHVGTLLNQLSFSHISARPRHPGQDVETIAAFKKTLPTR